jgi:hypothetical protein
MRELLALVLAGSALAGCGTAAYDKPGLTWEEWKRDDAECRRADEKEGQLPDRAAYARCMKQRGYHVRIE